MNERMSSIMILFAYTCLVLGMPILSVSASLAFDGTPWPGRLLYIIPVALFVLFSILVFRHARRRRTIHLVAGVILVPVMWLVTVAILGVVLISPGWMDGIR
jgi:hypothetical protein